MNESSDLPPMTVGGQDVPQIPSSCGPDPDQAPLVALLNVAKDRFNAAFDARLAESQFCALSLAHSRNVLRYLGDGPCRASQIVSRCGVSKQAVSQQIVQLEANGYLTSAPDPSDQRARMLTLTDKGRQAQQFVIATFAEIEQDWAGLIGQRDAAALRRALTKVAERVPGRSGC
ncbi:MAG: MarR family winged helix-turn-helix transcriptional regulator [Actinomycetales bacterium]